MVKKISLSITGICFFIFNACTKDVGKLPTASVTPTGCDTVTYTKHIKPIIDMNCALSGCHAGNTANPLLTSYELVKNRADAGRIKARVIDGNPSFMPQGALPLPQTQKDLITCWLNNGMKE
ncbi:MAG: hypothetical protein KF900_05435 [Bacteroidetes bacterium]|nr:hypothetical protein [Bacteroidota bacterium]